jgi:hypothetical protein
MTLVNLGAVIGGLVDATALPCTMQRGKSPTPTGWAGAFLGFLRPLFVCWLEGLVEWISLPGLVS